VDALLAHYLVHGARSFAGEHIRQLEGRERSRVRSKGHTQVRKVEYVVAEVLDQAAEQGYDLAIILQPLENGSLPRRLCVNPRWLISTRRNYFRPEIMPKKYVNESSPCPNARG
jgi:hypothetical protein